MSLFDQKKANGPEIVACGCKSTTCPRCRQLTTRKERFTLWFVETFNAMFSPPPPPQPNKKEEKKESNDDDEWLGTESEQEEADAHAKMSKKYEDQKSRPRRQALEPSLSTCQCCNDTRNIHRLAIQFLCKAIPSHHSEDSLYSKGIYKKSDWEMPKNDSSFYYKDQFQSRVSVLYPHPSCENEWDHYTGQEVERHYHVGGTSGRLELKDRPWPCRTLSKDALLERLDTAYYTIRSWTDEDYANSIHKGWQMVGEESGTVAWDMQYRLNNQNWRMQQKMYYVFVEVLVASLYFLERVHGIKDQGDLWRKYIFLPPMKCIECNKVVIPSIMYRRCWHCMELCCVYIDDVQNECMKSHLAKYHNTK